MHLLDRPAVLHEVMRKPIQQLGMTWRFAACAEIIQGPHQAFAKMMRPNAVHHDARGEGILRARDRSREFESTTAVFEWFVLREKFEITAGHFLTFIGWIASTEYAGILLLRLVCQGD